MADGEQNPCVIVLGASAGGVQALTRIVSDLPENLPAALAIVLHVAPRGTSVLPQILDRAGAFPVRAARDGATVEPGCAFVAPPDRHLTVRDGHFDVSYGPRENGHRPAIDRLFSTAAEAYGTRAIGVVLTGLLDDGTAGLAAIKQHGGTSVVQDPEDAMHRSMPANAIARVRVDHVVPVARIGPLLVELVAGNPPVSGAAPDPPLHSESPGSELDASPGMPAGEAAGLSCPECGGSLWFVEENGAQRFRCRIGHAYSEESLLSEQGQSLEIALWTAVRALEERAALLRRMAARADGAGLTKSAKSFAEQAGELDRRADVVRTHIAPGATEEAAAS